MLLPALWPLAAAVLAIALVHMLARVLGPRSPAGATAPAAAAKPPPGRQVVATAAAAARCGQASPPHPLQRAPALDACPLPLACRYVPWEEAKDRPEDVLVVDCTHSR